MTRAPAHVRVILGFSEGTPPPPNPDIGRDRFALLLLGPAIALTVVAASVGAGARPAQGAAPIASTAVVGDATFEVPEGATTVARLTAGAAGAAGARLAWTMTGGADAGHFVLSADLVVTLNHPVADFAPKSPSLSVEGATVVAVSLRVAAGEPADSYTVTLAPHGNRPFKFALLAGQPCVAGAVYTADGTPLTDVPPELSMPAMTTTRQPA